MYAICEPDPIAQEQIAALPADAVRSLAEVVKALSLSPWSGTPVKRENPDCNMLTWAFAGKGLVTYLVLEPQREVYIVRVQWI
ncbi:hypothetical protein AB0K60_11830 [Thermopolyspora sp. NPDC052614]|uniref:hypothetical protein n=1 Tax=Thermopolyspora sp. NPDC052614 TaxID=3155682 RepID=UPI003437D5D2